MNKNNLSESDLCGKVVRPAIVQAGWHTLDQIYAQYRLRAGRVVVRGKTARCDLATVLPANPYKPIWPRRWCKRCRSKDSNA